MRDQICVSGWRTAFPMLVWDSDPFLRSIHPAVPHISLWVEGARAAGRGEHHVPTPLSPLHLAPATHQAFPADALKLLFFTTS